VQRRLSKQYGLPGLIYGPACTGEVETIAEKVRGIASSLARGSRLRPGRRKSSSLRTVIDLVGGSGLRFEDAGGHELKGVSERWRLYRVISG
jgi:hypothetical protein